MADVEKVRGSGPRATLNPIAARALGGAALIGAPLVALLDGADAGRLLQFPPLLHRAEPTPGFSLPIFLAIAAPCLLAVVLVLAPRAFGFRATPRPAPAARSRLPAWFFAGLALIALAWPAAWIRPPFLGPLLPFTFVPLWLGLILAVDGLVHARCGRSRLARNPRAFAALFPVSALIWWYFEYLNRFVRNWWYEGSDLFGPATYVLFATLCFSTVLPAILVVTDFLHTFPALRVRFTRGPSWPQPPRAFAALWLAAGTAGLIALCRHPVPLFPLTWVAPLAISAGALALARIPNPFTPLREGDYSPLFLPGLAALGCGFFWEMWNFHALPKWHYAIPYVDILRIFEMPLLGWSGYLPFGPICLCLARLVGIVAFDPVQERPARGP